MSWIARIAGNDEVRERALRRLIEVDPMDVQGWGRLAAFLQARLAEPGRLEDLLSLPERSRRAIGRVPGDVYRAVARGWTATGRPDKAVELLREAQAQLPDHEAGAWIDVELERACRALGPESPEVTGCQPGSTG